MIRKQTKVRFALSTFTNPLNKKPFIGVVKWRGKNLAWVKPERYNGSFLPADRRRKVCLPVKSLEVI